MSKARVEPPDIYRLLNPGSVALVSVGDGERDNVFPVTWNMPVRKVPPLVAVLSGKGHHSYRFIERTGELAINVPIASMADAVLGCGSVSGSDGIDKFDRFGLTRQAASSIKAPLVAEAVANLECRVYQVVDMGASALLLAHVLEAVADARHFRDGHWSFDSGLQLIHHLSGQRFCVSDRAMEAQRPPRGG